MPSLAGAVGCCHWGQAQAKEKERRVKRKCENHSANTEQKPNIWSCSSHSVVLFLVRRVVRKHTARLKLACGPAVSAWTRQLAVLLLTTVHSEGLQWPCDPCTVG